MISERDLAEKFTVIWKEHFPLLTPNYMRIFNEVRPIKITNEIFGLQEIRYDLTSQLAFNCADKIAAKKISPLKMWNNTTLRPVVKQTAIEIWRKKEFTEIELRISKAEKQDCQSLCNNILNFIKITNTDNFLFKPKFIGNGIVPDLVGDLSIDDTLYEIKTVKRNFRSSDIKQLIIYLALAHTDGSCRWKYAGLYNPRMGVYCKFNIEKLIYDLSAGKSMTESFKNLLNSFSREVNVDSRF